MGSFPDDDDGQALAGLQADGVDLSKPRRIEFTVDVKNGEAAAALAKQLETRGYSCEVDYDEGEELEEGDEEDEEEFGPAWTIYASITMVPSYDDLVRRQEEIGAVAEKWDAVCDGWGTEA